MRALTASLFKLERGEGKLVALSFLQSLLIGVPRVFTLTCASTLFLAHFRAEDLPFVYAMTALVIPLVGVFNIFLQRRFSLTTVLTGSCLLMMLALFGLRISTGQGHDHQVAFLLRVWYEAEFTLTGLLFWSAANVLFSAQQAKRLFGLVGTGEVLASIIGGLLVPYLVAEDGAQSLLWFSIAGLALALCNLHFMKRAFPDRFAADVVQGEDGEHGSGAKSARALLRGRYPRLLLAMYALPAFCAYFFVDNLWVREVQTHFQSEAEIATFYGRFWAAYGAVTFVFRAFLSARLLALFGVAGGLIIPALTQVAFLAYIVWCGLFEAAFTMLLSLTIGLKFFERLNAGSLHYPAYYTLYQPLPKLEKAQIQTLAETVIGPALGFVISVFLVWLNRGLSLGTVQLAQVALPFCFVYVVVGVLTARGYRVALVEALQRGTLAAGSVRVLDAASRALIVRRLQSSDPREVTYCLSLLAENDHPQLDAQLGELIEHAEPQVRQAACKVIEQRGKAQHYAGLVTAFERERVPEVIPAMLRALGATGLLEAAPAALARLDDEDPAVRVAAMSCAVRYCGLEATVRAGSKLLALEASERADERALAARTLGAIGISNFCTGLRELLRDDDLEVRHAALEAAAALKNPQLWDAVIACLKRPGSRAAAQRALAAGAEGVMEALDRAYESAGHDFAFRRELIGILRRIAHKSACPSLLAKLADADHLARLDLLEALSACGHVASHGDASLRAYLAEDLGLMKRSAASIGELRGDPQLALLTSSLEEEWERARHRIYFVLSFMYPSAQVLKVFQNLDPATGGRTDLAAELLETTLRGADREHVVLLTTPLSRVLEALPEPSYAQRRARVSQIWNDFDAYRDRWTRACVIEAAGVLGLSELAPRLSEFSLRADDLLRETAEHALRASTRPPASDGSPAQVPASTQSSTVERVRRLKAVSMFASLSGGRLSDIAANVVELAYEASRDVVVEGELGTELYVVVSGKLRVHRQGKELATLGQGDVFGEWSALVPEKRAATVSTTSSAKLFRLSADDLSKTMEAQSDVVEGVVRRLAANLRGVTSASTGASHALHAEAQDVSQRSSERPLEARGSLGDLEQELTHLQRVIALKTVPALQAAPDDALSVLAERSQRRLLRSRESLVSEGELLTSMFVVIDGELAVQGGAHGDARNVGAGGRIGELAMLHPTSRTHDVVATRDTLLLAVGNHAVSELMRAYPMFAQAVIGALVAKLRARRFASG